MEKRERTDGKTISPINDKNHLHSVSTALIQSDIILFSFQYLFGVHRFHISNISLVCKRFTSLESQTFSWKQEKMKLSHFLRHKPECDHKSRQVIADIKALHHCLQPIHLGQNFVNFDRGFLFLTRGSLKQINVSRVPPLGHSDEHHNDLPPAQAHICKGSFGRGSIII